MRGQLVRLMLGNCEYKVSKLLKTFKFCIFQLHVNQEDVRDDALVQAATQFSMKSIVCVVCYISNCCLNLGAFELVVLPSICIVMKSKTK